MSVKVSQLVTDYIVQQIKQGKLQIGDKLPSERELMELVQVGRSSVREALHTLVDMDVVEKKMGIGVFVKRKDLNNLVNSYLLSALLDTKMSRDILEFRLLLELEVASKAAVMAEAEDYTRMEQALYMHERAINSDHSSIEADERFHKAIVLATGNQVLVKVYDFISDLLHSFKKDLLQVEEKSKSLDYHEKIYQAIRGRDPVSAKEMMRKHLEDVTKRFESIR